MPASLAVPRHAGKDLSGDGKAGMRSGVRRLSDVDSTSYLPALQELAWT
jgi:hypothetical protein